MEELGGNNVLNDLNFQTGPTCHTAKETMQLLHTKFTGRLASRFGDRNRPALDLTPMNYFLWCYSKQRIYANEPDSIPELKDEIHRVIRQIPQKLIEKVMENFIKRAEVYRLHLAVI